MTSLIPVRISSSNPGLVTRTSYLPMGRDRIKYCPVPSETVVRTAPVSTFVTVRVAPGTLAPDGSTTVPDKLADTCAKTEVGISSRPDKMQGSKRASRLARKPRSPWNPERLAEFKNPARVLDIIKIPHWFKNEGSLSNPRFPPPHGADIVF
jgi:hypothetical protein